MIGCVICGKPYTRTPTSKWKRRTCSRSCAVALSWRQKDGRENRIAGIKRQHATPQGKANSRERNRQRWAMPGQKENLAGLNRERWADDSYRDKTGTKIKSAWTPEMRAAAAERKRLYWKKQNSPGAPS